MANLRLEKGPCGECTEEQVTKALGSAIGHCLNIRDGDAPVEKLDTVINILQELADFFHEKATAINNP